MLLKTALTASLFFICTIVSFSQEACVTEPYKGYKGDCKLTVVMSNDGSYIYTSDRLSLKIWETSTNNIVNEISPFTYDLVMGTRNSNEILIYESEQNASNKSTSLYDISIKGIKKTTSIRNAEVNSIISKKGNYCKVTEAANKSLVFFKDGEGKIRKIDLKNKNKVTTYHGKFHSDQPVYLPAIGKLLDKKVVQLGGSSVSITVSILDVETDTWVDTKHFFTPDTNNLIDGRFIPFFSEKKINIIDVKTGALVAEEAVTFNCTNTGGSAFVYVKKDKTAFYLYSYLERLGKCSGMLEFSYPDFKLLSQTSLQNWSGLFNPENASYYYIPKHFEPNNKEFRITDLKSAKQTGTFSIEEKGVYANEDKYQAEREQRAMVGNKALEALYDIKPSVQPSHTGQRGLEKLIIDDYTDNGKVIMREFHSYSAACIVWKFPEGTPELLYKSDYMNPSTDANTVIVPGSIKQSMLSPSGNEVGFTSTLGGSYLQR